MNVEAPWSEDPDLRQDDENKSTVMLNSFQHLRTTKQSSPKEKKTQCHERMNMDTPWFEDPDLRQDDENK